MIRALCLDIEGGHGGSSRSLFHSLKHMDRSAVAVEVIARRPGLIEQRYASMGIPCRIVPELPKANSLQNWRANLRLYAETFWQAWRARAILAALAEEIEERFDLVHFNHESFWLIAWWLRRRTTKPIVMHVRTMSYPTAIARYIVRRICRDADWKVFITENEQGRFERGGCRGRGTVIYNIAEPLGATEPHPAIPSDGRFTVACLSNYTWERGTDRLVQIAVILAGRRRRDIRFVVAGDMRLPRYLSGALGDLGRDGGSLSDFAKARGVADWFLFLGHLSEPEKVLAVSDMLIKPTREYNPWGRDVIEGLAAGKPVASVGTYSVFVDDGRTGILQTEFDAETLADRLCQLADDRGACSAMGGEGRIRVARLCDGPARAAELLTVWTNMVIAGRRT